MNTDIQIFNNPQFGNIRIATNEYGEPIFCLSDVCKILELDPSAVMRRLGEGVISNHPLQTAGGMQRANFVNEDGLYDTILDSRKSEARQFRKWVTSEVLPSIRKHGGYLTPEAIEQTLTNPDFIIQLATSLKDERAKRTELEKQVKVLQPKAEFLDRVLDTDEKIDIGQAAKILGLPFGRNTLFAKLREKGVFFQNRNEPKQTYVDRKYFDLKEKWIERNNHDSFMVVKVLVTQKGLAFISSLFHVEPRSKTLAKFA